MERTGLKVGLRKFELKDRQMLLNGKRIVFKGVNRHEWSCRTGRTVSREEMLWDVKNLKAHNVNAVRTSHYPNDPYFLSSAMNTACMSSGRPIWRPTAHGRSWVRTARTSGRCRCPPGVAGKCACPRRSHAGTDKKPPGHPHLVLRQREPRRQDPVGDERVFPQHRPQPPCALRSGIFWNREYPATSDMESQMYTPVADIKKFLAEHPEKPFIMCEYSHAMGNSCGGITDYTEYAYEEPLYQGGFIWETWTTALQ